MMFLISEHGDTETGKFSEQNKSVNNYGVGHKNIKENYRNLKQHGLHHQLAIDRHPILIGVPFYALMATIPNAFIILISGVISPGDPGVPVFTKHGMWPFLILINPVAMTALGYLLMAGFYCCADRPKPFRAFLPTLILLFIFELSLFTGICYFIGLFNLLGLVAIILVHLTLFVTGVLVLRVRGHFDTLKALFKYGQVQLVLFIFFVELVGFIIAYRYSAPKVQTALTIALQISLFIFRKILLALTKTFPLDYAMLISAFWIPNLADMFQTLAYPTIKEWWVFVIIWSVDFITSCIQLFFLSRAWFVFQAKAKDCCTLKPLRGDRTWTPEDTSYDPDDRGQSPNSQGFRLRQARFYLWRCFSRFSSCIFFLGSSVVLRYGMNSKYYIFTEHPYEIISTNDFDYLTETKYIQSVVFVGVLAIAMVLAGIVGVVWIMWRYRETWDRLVEEVRGWDRTYFGMVAAIVVHNGILCNFIIMYHWKVYWAFSREPEDSDSIPNL